jgi:exosome complex component CSL4
MAAAPATTVVVVPGDELGAAAAYDAGPGTYVRDGRVYASRLGLRTESAAAAGGSGSRPALSVARPGGDDAAVPAVGSAVTARVTRITAQAAYAEIVVCDGATLPQPAAALIRREHVRDAEVDKIVMLDCFRPGDLVAAVVASLGDARAYFLTTAAPGLGVVHATSEAGELLLPHSHDTMVAPASGRRERRKVAKPSGNGAGS